jgi:hypothetical protein
LGSDWGSSSTNGRVKFESGFQGHQRFKYIADISFMHISLCDEFGYSQSPYFHIQLKMEIRWITISVHVNKEAHQYAEGSRAVGWGAGGIPGLSP